MGTSEGSVRARVRVTREFFHFESELKKPVALTIGKFDSLHLGHQKIFEQLRSRSKEGSKVVISFYPHPAKVLGLPTETSAILRLPQRAELLHSFGFQFLHLYRFTDALRQVSAQDFLDKYIKRVFNPQILIIGADARVGHKGHGDAAFIKEWAVKNSIDFEAVPLIESVASSTTTIQKVGTHTVRSLLTEGAMRSIHQILGRNYSMRGVVVKGFQRGRTIGFPTANVLPKKAQLPKLGVYATRVRLLDKWFPAISNLGEKPTLNDTQVILETHIMDYKGEEFYGERIEVELLQYIRPQTKFASLDDLRNQIELDCEQVRGVHSALLNAQIGN